MLASFGLTWIHILPALSFIPLSLFSFFINSVPERDDALDVHRRGNQKESSSSGRGERQRFHCHRKRKSLNGPVLTLR